MRDPDQSRIRGPCVPKVRHKKLEYSFVPKKEIKIQLRPPKLFMEDRPWERGIVPRKSQIRNSKAMITINVTVDPITEILILFREDTNKTTRVTIKGGEVPTAQASFLL